MSELSMMITVTDRSREGKLRKMYEENGATVSFVTLGRGTATSQVLDMFGLENAEKAIILTVVTDTSFKEIKKQLERRFQIDVPGTGVVFLVPLASVGGKKQLSFLLGEQEFVKDEEKTLKNTEYELIIVTANQGYSEKIMDAARAAGAGGGTILHAKGTGMKGGEKFFGFVLADEKEMIYIVARRDGRDKIMQAIMAEAGIRDKAQAICYSLPVTATAGMRLYRPSDEEA